ncbi:hypothetical protein [Seonamhaeicola maritimus]|uniref:Porin family protein n=1 Tax=Seonamhaeicola maritimus TaxID=2591822 RepID=A0A5C7GKA0_9FLAO|nr:hypothetical protein [Seonamhaeicola maritimus]TXG38655.1 hypothetical protein FUA22_01875 [Seonamhaeicola maritimus]
MKNLRSLLIVILLALFLIKVNAQEGFSLGVNIGPVTGDSSDYFSYTLLGDFYYLWSVSDSFDLGAATGVLVFLGEGNNSDGSNGLFSSIPDVFIPIAIASRANLAESFYMGLDIGYALNANGFGDSDGGLISDDYGGFYFKPLVAYKIKEKLALVLAYSSISEKNYNSSSISLGLNFGF